MQKPLLKTGCVICVFLTGEHMELYTRNFHDLPGAEIELRGNHCITKVHHSLVC